jgi:hypothetical protein
MGPEAMNAHIDRMIQQYGFALVTIGDATPPFAYSVGLTPTFGVPEIIVVGNFGPPILGALSACVHAFATSNPGALRGRGPSIPGALSCTNPSDPSGPPAKFAIGWRPVPRNKVGPDSATPMSMTASRLGNTAFEVRQVFVPDPNGKLPWEAGCNPAWVRDSAQTELYK